jgi:hypothetical protein
MKWQRITWQTGASQAGKVARNIVFEPCWLNIEGQRMC